MKMIIWTITSVLLTTLVVVYGQATGRLSLRACPGSDASIIFVCSVYPNTLIWTPAEFFSMNAWTWNAQGCPFGRIRTLIRFPKLNLIPSCAKIVSAKLSLFGAGPNQAYPQGAFSCYSNSPVASYCPNDVSITRITQSWSPSTVTWNTQPSAIGPASTIPTSTSQYYYNPTVDVTSHVQSMVQFKETLYGFKLVLTNENYYRIMTFYSSHAADVNKRPLLEVDYTVPCDCEPCKG